jgi:hypothetical protein
MGLRLTLALSLISGATQLVVFWRLSVLGLGLRYWYFSLYMLCGALQCTGWLLGPRESFAYAAFWVCTTPVMIGLRVAVVVELWNMFQSQYGANRISRRVAMWAVALAVGVSLATGIDLWLVGWHPTVFRLFSLAIRYSASTLAILCALVTWVGHESGRALPTNLVRHAFLLTGYFASLAAGHLVAHLSGGDSTVGGLIMAIAATAVFILWPILLTRDGESSIARGGGDPPISGALATGERR